MLVSLLGLVSIAHELESLKNTEVRYVEYVSCVKDRVEFVLRFFTSDKLVNRGFRRCNFETESVTCSYLIQGFVLFTGCA